MKYKALGVIGVVLLVLLTAPSTLGQTTTGVEGKPTAPTLIVWRYIWWDPSVIYADSVTHLHAGMDVLALGRSRYSIRVVIYDPYPDINGRPVIVSHTIVGCSPGPGFRFNYDRARRAWVFYSGICDAMGIFSNNFGITARWQPRIFGEYRAEVTTCIHEPIGGGCESRSDTLVVLWRTRPRPR